MIITSGDYRFSMVSNIILESSFLKIVSILAVIFLQNRN